ncbi:head decoration protein [Sphingomonas sp. CARO-RG-8B-R24-01]|uniref:head decoration protein n=1 Tax=Sphingomonas sp. CARO-RG-8B-R24-01 TaxID=2914831 RepID=UPI001F56FFE9|nr:head decoration protein [Sphingomonas sp. CARO-RG-8B-R24-01]
MTLTPTNQTNNPFQPGVSQDAFIPDQLIGGDLKVVTHAGRTITGGAFRRGTVLGKITSGPKTGAFTIAVSTATDGSQVPTNLLVDDVDASAGDAIGGIYAMGEFNERAVILDASMSLATAKAALETQNIYLKSSISAADPS